MERLLLRVRLELAGARTRARKQEVRELLEELAKSGGERNPQLALFLAEGFGAVDDPERGLRYTRRVLSADAENAPALALEARLHQASGRHEQAVTRAIDSLALVYLQPGLHCTLGQSLAALKEWERAEAAFRIALAQAPGLIKAHEGLARLLRRDPARIGDASLHMARAAAARAHRKVAVAAVERSSEAAGLPGMESSAAMPSGPRGNAVTIVAGLPRSGTSMMMQMLAAGGVEAFTDGRREADEDNPRGYLEHEKATQLHRDTAWVPQARGKVVKIVAHLLPYLPPGEEYRIVFMHRALEEVTASQTAMLKRLGRKGGGLPEAEMARVFAGQLVRVQEWLKRAPGVHVLTMQYGQVLADPAAASRRLAEFLGDGFDADKAASAVDAALRRQGR
jgi:tetratricopeptide (TPR) repeat protein